MEVIKLLAPSDFQIFKDIRLEALQLDPDNFASTYNDWAALTDEEWQGRISVNPTFVAFKNNTPVGIMGLMKHGFAKTAHRVILIMVYVAKAARGTGVANGLMNAVIGQARDLGFRQIELACNADNMQAVRFYQRHGFMEFGQIEHGTFDSGTYRPEILMVKKLV